MYFVIEIFTENFPLNDKIIKDKEKIQVVMDNINIIYKQIKKNEHSPNTEYLYNNLNTSNLQQSIIKLERMNAISEEFIPRLLVNENENRPDII